MNFLVSLIRLDYQLDMRKHKNYTQEAFEISLSSNGGDRRSVDHVIPHWRLDKHVDILCSLCTREKESQKWLYRYRYFIHNFRDNCVNRPVVLMILYNTPNYYGFYTDMPMYGAMNGRLASWAVQYGIKPPSEVRVVRVKPFMCSPVRCNKLSCTRLCAILGRHCCKQAAELR